ncbi:MAG: hypothetical protein WHU10_00630 [Fimbriimonadales bacterium]
MLAPLLFASLLATGPRIGLAAGVPEGAKEEDYLRILRQQVRLGLDAGLLSLKWDEYESQGGKPLEDGLGIARFSGQRLLLNVATVDTVRKRLPADVQDLSWDDPKLFQRFEPFLRKVLERAGPHLGWLSLGNEADIYLAGHSNETEAYLRFLDRARRLARGISPALPVGVTITCRDGQKHRQLVERLTRGMDVAIATYYPMDGLRPTLERMDGDFEFLFEVASGRPLVLQEIGCPSSPEIGSSEEVQARFVRMVFERLARHKARIAAAIFFLQVDFPPSLLGVLEEYYGIRDASFRAFLASLGFQDSRGRPKQAWREFVDTMARVRPVSVDSL